MIAKLTALILMLVSTNPKNPLHDNEERAEKVAIEIKEAADMFSQDPVELLTWAYYESSLDSRNVGDLGEVGYMQAHGVAANMCRKVGYEPGSFLCGAYLWMYGEIECDSHYRALLWYASGKCEGTPRAKRIVEFRTRKVERWKSMK